MSLVFSQITCNSGQTPIAVGFFEFLNVYALFSKLSGKVLQGPARVLNQMDEGRVPFPGRTRREGQGECGMGSLNCLVLRFDISARYHVQSFSVLHLHCSYVLVEKLLLEAMPLKGIEPFSVGFRDLCFPTKLQGLESLGWEGPTPYWESILETTHDQVRETP